MIKLDIISDPICPWCYIGKSYLDRALQDDPEHPFVIEWHPFQLNPDMPAEGMDRREYLETKFGGKEGAVRVYSQIETAATAAGLKINWEGVKRTPNTLNAHRLIHWAGIEQRQGFVVDALFKANFEQGKDIGDTDTLVEIAESCEMDGDAVRKLLEGDADRADISARDANSRAKGVTGVPTFIIANQHAVPGAQKPEMWAQVIADIKSQMKDAET